VKIGNKTVDELKAETEQLLKELWGQTVTNTGMRKREKDMFKRIAGASWINGKEERTKHHRELLRTCAMLGNNKEERCQKALDEVH